MIYTNVEEYAKTCKCSIEIAQKRCDYYLGLFQKAEKVVCPSCKSNNDSLAFDDDGSDFPSETFVSCTTCWEAYDLDDHRIKDWVDWKSDFDEVLAIANSEENPEEFVGQAWEQFVEESTSKLLSEVLS